jgi:hypothetical protein
MASQVAHIVYASKYLKKYPIKKEDEFLLGCTFPDIRRVDEKVKRRDTHLVLENLNLDLKYLDAFQAGWKFHLYCDMRREEILNSYNFYKLPGTMDMWDQPNKLLEDEIVYGSYDNWEKVTHLFNNPPEIELPNFINRETFEIWYAILAKYFEKRPDSSSMKIFISKQLKIERVADDLVAAVDKLRKNGKVVEILAKVKNEIISEA